MNKSRYFIPAGFPARGKAKGKFVMQALGVKKFFLDYLVGSGLIFLLFFMLMGNMTVMDTQVNLKLSQGCSQPFPEEDVLQSIQGSLREGESCEVVSPCDQWQVIRCEGTVTMSSLYKTILGSDLLVFRVKESPVKSFKIWNYKDSSVFRIPLSFILLLVAYGVVLAEAGAMLFALWRQNKLKETLTLPAASKKDQLLKPILFAMLLAVVVVLMNYLVFNLFDHPEVAGRELISTLLKSATGIVIIVILAPLAEELIFRGVFLRFFVEKKYVLLGTVLVSLLFSAVHGFFEQGLGWQLYISSIYFLMSVFLCRLYIKQKNIWSPIVFHSGYNSTMVLLFMLFG